MYNFDEILCKAVQDNRRVIIPNLGAFINNFDDGAIVFSPLLKTNDGFLEEEMQKEGIANPAEFLSQFTENVNYVIDNGQNFNIAGLGYFFSDGGIQFEYQKAEESLGIQEYREENKTYLGFIFLAVCLCLLGFSALIFFLLGMSDARGQLDPLISQTEKPENQFVIIDKSGDETMIDNEITDLKTPQINITYHVVAGCFEEKTNAEYFVVQCKKMGYNDSEILPQTGLLYPVSIGNFTTWDEAVNKKNEYNSKFGENSWILKIK
ncbi:MAG: hypothetical protein LBT50_08980 [Prevotellaceae bacterium]|jgi:hypothetical protein|nr:hypothetical protein [Prevotellaceae bacterium]